jgi:hypothetical protein
MWPFSKPTTTEDVSKRLNRLEEETESLRRRFSSLVEDVDEYFRKVNKARQRVVKEERDGEIRTEVPLNETREQQKARLRQQLRARQA